MLWHIAAKRVSGDMSVAGEERGAVHRTAMPAKDADLLAALSAILDRQTSEIDPTRLMKLRTAVAPDGGARKVCSADLAQWHSVEASQHVIGHRGMIPGQLLLFVT